MSGSSLFSSHTHLPPPPASHIFIISVVAQAEPAPVHPWVTSEDSIYKLDIGQSDILDSFVAPSTMACCSMIIFIASVYLSLDVSLQDSNVKPGLGAVPQIYWSIDCLTVPTSALSDLTLAVNTPAEPRLQTC